VSRVFGQLRGHGVGRVRMERDFAGFVRGRLGRRPAGERFQDFECKGVQSRSVSGEVELAGGVAKQGVTKHVGPFGLHW
jgi:hypothetical protein